VISNDIDFFMVWAPQKRTPGDEIRETRDKKPVKANDANQKLFGKKAGFPCLYLRATLSPIKVVKKFVWNGSRFSSESYENESA